MAAVVVVVVMAAAVVGAIVVAGLEVAAGLEAVMVLALYPHDVAAVVSSHRRHPTNKFDIYELSFSGCFRPRSHYFSEAVTHF